MTKTNSEIQDPQLAFPNISNHVLTDNSGIWNGQFNYLITSRGSDEYSVSIFVDNNQDTQPDRPDMIATSPIIC